GGARILRLLRKLDDFPRAQPRRRTQGRGPISACDGPVNSRNRPGLRNFTISAVGRFRRDRRERKRSLRSRRNRPPYTPCAAARTLTSSPHSGRPLPPTPGTDMAEHYIFTIENLTKAYNKREVLKNIWLAFYPGAKIGVIGPNGSGKSTLLRIMAVQDTDFLGTARLTDGFSVGFVPQ